MLTIQYGYKLPQNTDTGDQFFPALEFDIQRLATHSHNGVDSAPVAVTSQNILSANWVADDIIVGSGLYFQVITMPTGFLYDSCDIWFRLSTGEFVYPSITRTDANKYRVWTNNNALSYVALYR